MNQVFSVSRLKKFEQCPLAYRMHYIDKGPKAGARGDAAELGSVVHAALEQAYRWVVGEEFSGTVPAEVVLDGFRAAFRESSLSGAELYAEGLELIRGHFSRRGVVDHASVIAMEKEFEIPLGRFSLMGYIDRVDRVEEDHAHVTDYKTGWMLFTPDEVKGDIQASAYVSAVRKLYPWAKKVTFGFDMLRHGVELKAERSEETLESHFDYMRNLAETIKTTIECASRADDRGMFQPKLSSLCPWCDHRERCGTYKDALARKLEIVVSDPEDVEAICREREEVHALTKILDARKKDLEKVIRARISKEGPFVAAGNSYSLIPTYEKNYPVGRLIETLARYSGQPAESFRDDLLVVDKKALEKFVKKLDPVEKGARYHASPKTRLLKAEIDAIAERALSFTRFDSQLVRK